MKQIPMDSDAPAAAPTEDWGDFEGTGTLLPPRRARPKSQSIQAVTGLRIESSIRATSARHSQSSGDEVPEVLRLAPEPLTELHMRRLPALACDEEAQDDPAMPVAEKPWGRSRHLKMRWMLGSGVAVAFTVLVSISLLPRVNRSNAAHFHPGDKRMVVDRSELPEGMAGLNRLLGKRAEAERLLKRLASPAAWDEVKQWIWHAEEVAPMARSRPWTPLLSPDEPLPADSTWDVIAVAGCPIAKLSGTLPDGSRLCAYWRMSESQQLQLDWKASSGFGSATFDELEQQRGDPAEIRCRLRGTEYYTQAYPEDRYRSYQLISPDTKRSVWGYVRRGTPADTALRDMLRQAEIFQSEAVGANVLLRLASGPPESLPNQWLIADLLCPEWASS